MPRAVLLDTETNTPLAVVDLNPEIFHRGYAALEMPATVRGVDFRNADSPDDLAVTKLRMHIIAVSPCHLVAVEGPLAIKMLRLAYSTLQERQQLEQEHGYQEWGSTCMRAAKLRYDLERLLAGP